MTRIPALVFVLLLCACWPRPAAPPPAPAAPAWEPLWNGRDLEGWDVLGTAAWRVQDGAIVGGQDGDPKRSGVLATRAQYQDFELELEFMIDEHGKYNSGVYLRNVPGATGRTGYQVNIGRAAAGEFTGGIYTDSWLTRGDDRDAVRKPLGWNALRVRAVGSQIAVHLNGVQVSNLVDAAPDPKLLAPGVIAFQTYGAEGHSGWVKFRKLRIRRL